MEDRYSLTKHQITFDEYLERVVLESRTLGEIHPQAYYFEIQEKYHYGRSVGECVGLVFN